MNDQVFSQQHGRLLDTQCSGLGSAWHRAAENRQEDETTADPQAGTGSLLKWMLPAVGVVAVAGYLLSLWLDDRVDEPMPTGTIVSSPLPPAGPASGPA